MERADRTIKAVDQPILFPAAPVRKLRREQARDVEMDNAKEEDIPISPNEPF
jgi:hypothetical protein